MRMGVCVLVLIGVVATIAGCASPDSAASLDDNAATRSQEQPEPPPLPGWTRDVPSEPGVAFYSVGVASDEAAADDAARRDLIIRPARVARQAGLSLGRQTLAGPTSELTEQRLAQYLEAVAVGCARIESRTVLRHTDRRAGTDSPCVFSLARCTFKSVSEAFYKAAYRLLDFRLMNPKCLDPWGVEELLQKEQLPMVAPPDGMHTATATGDE